MKVKERSLDDLTAMLDIRFRDMSLLDKALLHRSYAAQHGIEKDNERLEFLGDSVLNACVSEYLYRKFPQKNEGQLTQIRSRLVSGKKLREWGEEKGIADFIRTADDFSDIRGDARTHVIEDAMEALIGALFLDQGYRAVYEFVSSYMKNRDFFEIVDYKSRLQELSVEKYRKIPEYIVTSEKGEPHRKEFEALVLVNETVMGKGNGLSKKDAQQAAAEIAYKKMKNSATEEKND